MRDALARAVTWIDSLDAQEVKRLLVDDDEDVPRVFGFGRKGSPIRECLLAYTCRELAETDAATAHAATAISAGAQGNMMAHLRADFGECS